MSINRVAARRALSAAAIGILVFGVTPDAWGQALGDWGRSPAAVQLGAEPEITPEQFATLQQRVRLTFALVDRLEGEAKLLGRAAGWRQATVESLLALPLGRLQQLQSVTSLEALATGIATPSSTIRPYAFGSTTQDLVYKPIAPCRYIDTRNVGGKINGTRGYDLALNGSSYGGVAACAPTTLFGVGENAFGAIAMNVTIVNPSDAPSFLAVKPNTGAPVTSLINWYEFGPTVMAANQAVLTMDQSGSGSEFIIQTSGATHVIVDIFGAFIAPEATALSCTQVESAEATIPNNAWTAVDALCPTGYTATGGGFDTPEGTLGYPNMWHTMVPLTNGWRVWWDNQTGGNRRATTWVRCCRVPGR